MTVALIYPNRLVEYFDYCLYYIFYYMCRHMYGYTGSLINVLTDMRIGGIGDTIQP